MHFWRIKPLAHELRENKVSFFETIIYAVTATLLSITGLTTLTWLPILYYYLFSLVKNYLEKQAEPAPLTIMVFNDFSFTFILIKITMLITGILFCLAIAKKFNVAILKKIVCLFVPVNIRLVALSTALFLIIFFVFDIYFAVKLMQISATETNGSILSKVSPVTLVKSGWGLWSNFKKAGFIFDQINVVSYGFYLGAQLLSIITTAATFLLIALNIKHK